MEETASTSASGNRGREDPAKATQNDGTCCSRKWKDSTKENNVNRVSVHLVSKFGRLELSGFRRDELQDLLDVKAHSGLSFSVVDHLRWDMKQIFDMAVAEGQIERNPALLLFTPKYAAKPVRRVMNIKEVQNCFAALDQRERLIAKLAVIAGCVQAKYSR